MVHRVAIIGAGLAGSLAALELARREIPSKVFERNERVLSEASLFNEGKIHLGFLYAKDQSLKTSQLMVEGATHFRGIIDELTGFDVAEALSTPFWYGVHRDSLVTPKAFEAHLKRCTDEFSRSMQATPSSAGYVNRSRALGFELLSTAQWSDDLSPEFFSAVFRTDEYGVDPRILAREVERALRESPFIELHTGVSVERVNSLSSGGWLLHDSQGSDIGAGRFDVVLNSTWSDLLRLDSQVGIPLPEDWSYRYKLGNRVSRAVSVGELNSVTVVLGAFGDIVNYGRDGGIFVSWYPTGRLLMTDDVSLPDWNSPVFENQRRDAYEKSRVTWETMSAKLRALNIAESEVDTRGGMILATGRLDVDDPASPLHSRVRIGISQRDSYFSLNTGKYTLAPLMAVRAAGTIQNYLSGL